MSDVPGRGPGGWRGADELDFGTGKAKETMYCQCPHCGSVKSYNERTVGIICSNCEKYFRIEDAKPATDEEIAGSTAPHFVTEQAQRMLKFRGKMEQKAHNWKDKQLARRKQPGYKPVHHGPIDPDTGERTK